MPKDAEGCKSCLFINPVSRYQSRDKEEQEIREKMGKGIIGTAGFQEQIDKKVIENKRPGRGRPRKYSVTI